MPSLRVHQYRLALETIDREPEGQERWNALQLIGTLLQHDMADEALKIKMARAMAETNPEEPNAI